MSSEESAVQVEVQYASEAEHLPSEEQFVCWVTAALGDVGKLTEVVLRVVDEPESAHLNETFRNKSGATNVLSFSVDVPPEANVALVGDLVICAPIVQKEARQQGKAGSAHWAHMVVHGVLHLLGYDHSETDQALRMEHQEIVILQHLGYDNPYLSET